MKSRLTWSWHFRDEATPLVVGHGDVMGFRGALGDAAVLSRLIVALKLISVEKAKYRNPCWY